jgi:predicted nucleic acid-binding protein
MRLTAVTERSEPLITGGLLATCATLDAEPLHSARSPVEHEQVRAGRRQAHERLPTDDGRCQRALEAQRDLARTGRHRAVGIGDLLTVGLPAEHGTTVLHHDSNFETAADVLDFGHRWACHAEPRGAMPGRYAAAGVRGATRYIAQRVCLRRN